MIEMLMRISADASGVERAMAKTREAGKKTVTAIGSEIEKRIGRAMSVDALFSGISRFASMISSTVDEVKDLSDQLDLSAENVQRLQVGADRAGVKFTNVTSALQRIEDLRAQAMAGDKNAVGLFGALGIDPFKGNTLDILTAAVEASSRGVKEQGALFDMVGKKANALRNVVFELQSLGPVNLFDEDAIRAVDEVNNAIKDIKRNIVASSAPELGFWGRALKRGAEIDQKSPGAFNFALTRGIIAEMMGGTEGGVDLSALPLPLKSGAKQAPTLSPVASSAVSLGTQGDALSRIGLFVGGRPEARSLASIEKNTAETVRQLNKATRYLGDILQNQEGAV